MGTMTAPVGLTPEDVLALPDSDRYELIDGRLVELEVSLKSQYVATLLSYLLLSYCRPSGLAHVFTEAGIVCFPGRLNKMRRPDVCCVRWDRLSYDQIGDGFLSIRPDLVVEVISPNDLVYDLEAKLDDYRDAGIPVIWLVYPPSRRVRVIRPDGPPVELGGDDVLTCEGILPGFRCPVSDLFSDPPQPAAGPAGA